MAVLGRIAVSAKQSARKPAPATVFPNSCVATPNYAMSKISFVQDTVCTITGRWYRLPSSLLWLVWHKECEWTIPCLAKRRVATVLCRTCAERRAFLVSQLMPVTKLLREKPCGSRYMEALSWDQYSCKAQQIPNEISRCWKMRRIRMCVQHHIGYACNSLSTTSSSLISCETLRIKLFPGDRLCIVDHGISNKISGPHAARFFSLGSSEVTSVTYGLRTIDDLKKYIDAATIDMPPRTTERMRCSVQHRINLCE
jgi:hypothetical protein